MFEREVSLCNTLARTVQERCVIVQCGSVVCTVLATDVEPGMTVLYATIDNCLIATRVGVRARASNETV